MYYDKRREKEKLSKFIKSFVFSEGYEGGKVGES